MNDCKFFKVSIENSLYHLKLLNNKFKDHFKQNITSYVNYLEYKKLIH